MKRLIHLGSWCRTAYQCRFHAEMLGLEATLSTPFDWTITPFRSLSQILKGDLAVEDVLNPIDSFVNRVGSVTCGYSGISFHHDLSITVVRKYGGEKNESEIPEDLLLSPEWQAARLRFQHTHSNFRNICNEPGNLYVRWMCTGKGRGPAVAQFPEVFDGETPQKTLALLSQGGFLGESGLLYITTEIIDNVRSPIDNPISHFNKIDSNCWECSLHERRGYNGDQTTNFKGDEASWGTILNLIASSSHGISQS